MHILMIRRGVVMAAVTMALAMSLGAVALRAETPREIAGRIPTSVSEVIVGGQWSEADDTGFYRAVLIFRIVDGTSVADILVQWLTVDEPASNPEVVHSEVITSITGQKAETAFVALDFGDDDNEATRLLIGTYDPETEKDTTRFVRLGAPADFAFVKEPRTRDSGE